MTREPTPEEVVLPDVHSKLAAEHGTLAAEHKKLAVEHESLAEKHGPLARGEESGTGSKWVKVIEVIGAVLVAIIGLITAYQAGQRSSSEKATPPSPTTTVEARAFATIVSPRRNQAVPRCITVEVQAEIPDAKALAVAAREETDTRLYFEGHVEGKSDKQWSAQLELGDKESVGNAFIVHVYVMDKQLKDYLASTNATPGATWWSSPDLPPGARSIAQTEVQRSSNSIACS